MTQKSQIDNPLTTTGCGGDPAVILLSVAFKNTCLFLGSLAFSLILFFSFSISFFCAVMWLLLSAIKCFMSICRLVIEFADFDLGSLAICKYNDYPSNLKERKIRPAIIFC